MQVSCRHCLMAQDIEDPSKQTNSVLWACQFCQTINIQQVSSEQIRQEQFVTGCLYRAVIVIAALFVLAAVAACAWLLPIPPM